MNTEERIIQIVATSMCVDKATITSATTFDGDLAADSLDMVEMTMSVEDAFEIQVPDQHATSFATVGDLVNYVGCAMENLRAKNSQVVA